MPTFIVKPDPDEDFYVWWSSVVDNAVGFGPRDNSEDPNRFDRADKEGSSAIFGSPGNQPYGWNDERFILCNEESLPDKENGYWTLPRKNLKEFCLRGEDADVTDLVEFNEYEE